MSETATEAPITEAEQHTATEAPPKEEPKAAETDWKAEARKWESRAKENADKAKQFDKTVEAQKTEQQKLEERATKAETDAQNAAREAARLRVALDKGLTPSQAKRLVGDTEDELAKDADELLADIAPGKARGDIGQGARQTDAKPDMNQLIRAATGRG